MSAKFPLRKSNNPQTIVNGNSNPNKSQNVSQKVQSNAYLAAREKLAHYDYTSTKFIETSIALVASMEIVSKSTFDAIQHLQVTNKSLQQCNQQLQNSNRLFEEQLQRQSVYDQLDVRDVLRATDERSQILLELVSGHKAAEDCLMELESRFMKREIDLEVMLRLVRKLEQDRFTYMQYIKIILKDQSSRSD